MEAFIFIHCKLKSITFYRMLLFTAIFEYLKSYTPLGKILNVMFLLRNVYNMELKIETDRYVIPCFYRGNFYSIVLPRKNIMPKFGIDFPDREKYEGPNHDFFGIIYTPKVLKTCAIDTMTDKFLDENLPLADPIG